MYIILSVTNSSPTITKDANECQYFEASFKIKKNKALDGKLHLQEHKPNSLSLCPCSVFNSSKYLFEKLSIQFIQYYSDNRSRMLTSIRY